MGCVSLVLLVGGLGLGNGGSEGRINPARAPTTLTFEGLWGGTLRFEVGSENERILLFGGHGASLKDSNDMTLQFSAPTEGTVEVRCKGKNHRGIYRLEGSRVLICFDEESPEVRPTSYTPGDGRILLTIWPVSDIDLFFRKK